ncbi:hypothetical protein Tco_0740604 [Tanacetum coccineum]
MTVVDVLMTPPFAPRLSGIAQTCPGFIGTPGHVSAIPLSRNAEGGVMSTSTAVTIPETHTLTPESKLNFLNLVVGFIGAPEHVSAILRSSGETKNQNIQEQSLRMIREQDEEEEDEKSGLHSIAMRPVSNIGGNGLNTKTCSVNALNNKEQQLGLCGIQNIAPQRHPTKERTVPSDIDMIQESVATVTTPADVVTTNTCNGDVSAPNTCNNRRQTEIRDRLRVPRARPNRQLQLDEQPTTSANKKITLVYGLQ